MTSLIGYRKFIVTMTVILIASLLVGLRVILPETYADLIKVTVGLYMGGSVFTRMADRGSAPAAQGKAGQP